MHLTEQLKLTTTVHPSLAESVGRVLLTPHFFLAAKFAFPLPAPSLFRAPVQGALVPSSAAPDLGNVVFLGLELIRSGSLSGWLRSFQ